MSILDQIADQETAQLTDAGPSLAYVASTFVGGFLGVLLFGRLFKWLIEENFKVFAPPLIVYSSAGIMMFFAATYGYADSGGQYFGLEPWVYLLSGFLLIMFDTNRIDSMREYFDKKINKSTDRERDISEDTRRSVEE